MQLKKTQRLNTILYSNLDKDVIRDLMSLICLTKQLYEYNFLFINIKTVSSTPSYIPDIMINFQKNFNKFTKTKEFRDINKGYIRKSELTYNPSNNTYTVHYHIILAVNKSYYNSKNYISRNKWLKLWQSIDKTANPTNIRVLKTTLMDLEEIYNKITHSAGTNCPLDFDTYVWHTFYEALYNQKLINLNEIFKHLYTNYKRTLKEQANIIDYKAIKQLINAKAPVEHKK